MKSKKELGHIKETALTSFIFSASTLALVSAVVLTSACSTTTHFKWDDHTKRWTYQKAAGAGAVLEITPDEMTQEQKKPVFPLQQSPYVIEDVEEIPVLTPREEALEGAEEYYLGRHDILRITTFGHQKTEKGTADIVRDAEIRDDGMISYPLIGDIKAVGLTIPELQQGIVKRLKAYIVAPKIDIQIIKYGSQNVSILGEVKAPQVIYLKGRTTLLEAITMSGGLTENANLKGVYIVRKDKIIPIDLYALMIEGDLKYNVELKRKDIVYIPNVQEQRVYVLGEVNSSRVVPFARNILTVAEAIASAGDFKISAKESNIKVIRGGLENPTIITIDFNKITKGDAAENIALHSEDIVFVPASLVGEWNKILQQITLSLQTLMFGPTLENLTN